MENDKKEYEIDVLVLLKNLKGNIKPIIKYGIVGFVIGVVIAFSIPKEYLSIAKIAPESKTKEVSSSATALASMIGMSSMMNEDGIRENLYPEILNSTPFLMEFSDIKIEDSNGSQFLMSDYILKEQKKPWWSILLSLPFDLVKSMGESSNLDTVTVHNSYKLRYAFTEKMKKCISANIDKKTGVITINSVFQDPVIAKTMADTALYKLQEYITHYRTTKTRSILESNMRMYEEAKCNFIKADKQYIEALDKNLDVNTNKAKARLELLKNERDVYFNIYNHLAEQVESDKIKLQEETPIATIIEPSIMPIKAKSPNKIMIVFSFVLIGVVYKSTKIVIKQLKGEA